MLRPLARAISAGLALCVPVALAVSPALAQPRRYTLDPATSRLTIHVGKTGVFGFAGHEHEIVAGGFQGTATLDPERVAESAVDLRFDAGGLRVEGKGEPSGDLPQVQATMVGPGCLDARRFPTVHFVSKSASPVGVASRSDHAFDLDLHGDLTLHGVTRPLTVRAHLEIVGDALEAAGTTTIRQTDFGITPISKGGVVKVKDELVLRWRIHGTAR